MASRTFVTNGTIAFPHASQTLQKPAAADGGGPIGRDGLDMAFRDELRRRFEELHQSVCEARDVLSEKEKMQKGRTAHKKTKTGEKKKSVEIAAPVQTNKKDD